MRGARRCQWYLGARRPCLGLLLFGVALAPRPAPAQSRARIIAEKFDSVKADLSKLGELEKTYYRRNRAFTVDTAALHFKPTSGAQISISYASARAWAASATHPTLAPFVCFPDGDLPEGRQLARTAILPGLAARHGGVGDRESRCGSRGRHASEEGRSTSAPVEDCARYPVRVFTSFTATGPNDTFSLGEILLCGPLRREECAITVLHGV